MRKALIGLIVAATALSPAAALAQRGHRVSNDGPDEQRFERTQRRSEARQQRTEQPQAQPQQQREQPQQQQQQVVRNDRRGNDGNRGGDNGNRNWRGGNDGNRSGDNGNRNWRGDGNRGRAQQPSIYPQAWQGNPNDPRLRRYQQRERENQQRYGGDWRDNNRRDNDRRDDRNWRGDDRRGDWRNNGRRWDNNWRNDNRYDWRGWRNRNRNVFHVGRYYSPYRNWGYNRFSIGIFLEPLFYSRDYWIGDPWQYRLPEAYPGTQWVRYYNDVILVDVYSGEVIDVIYDFFW